MDFNQWSTTKTLVQGFPTWVSGEDSERIAAYQLYEMIYWNIPESFKIIQRGSDTKPIYIPAARQIIETMHRFFAPGLQIGVDPQMGSTAEQAEAMAWMNDFMRRERLLSKFTTNKRYGLIRGDWLFRLRGDPERPEGARLSIEAIDPASYFPIFDEDDLDVRIGAHIVEQMIDDTGKPVIFRHTYRKATGTGGPSPITLEEAIFESDAWGGPSMDEKRVAMITPEFTLPSPIDQIPLYHIQNFAETGSPWGSSELRGLERMLSAINQSISDEELELVLNGLGVYVTDSGSPVDDDGNDVPWNLGPARVVEIGTGKSFTRVAGVSSVTPHQDHLKYLHDQLDLGTGTPAVAKGLVEVATAESGIALALQFGPLFARAVEKEQIVTDVTINMLWDLKKWAAAFETVNFDNIAWLPLYGERIPQNRAERFTEIMSLAGLTPPVVSAEWVRAELSKIGYVFPDDTTITGQILTGLQAAAQVQSDITGFRIDSELETSDDSGA